MRKKTIISVGVISLLLLIVIFASLNKDFSYSLKCNSLTQNTIGKATNLNCKSPTISKEVGTITIKTSTLPYGLTDLSCAASSTTNKIYCFGGSGRKAFLSNQILEYDPITDILTTKTATLPSGRFVLSCATSLATNKIYCFGGLSKSGHSNQILEYDPVADILKTKTAMLPSGIGNLSCAASSATNKIYCFGGLGDKSSLSNQILEYDPSTDILTVKDSTLPSGRMSLSCTESSATNKIYCFGGGDSNAISQILEYDPVGDALIVKDTTLPTERTGLSCTESLSVNKIYCFGGNSINTSFDQILEYDPVIDILVVKSATLPSARDGLSCTESSANNNIYCFGGSYLDQIIEYNPSL